MLCPYRERTFRHKEERGFPKAILVFCVAPAFAPEKPVEISLCPHPKADESTLEHPTLPKCGSSVGFPQKPHFLIGLNASDNPQPTAP